jgi:uncharacterized protein
MSSRLSKQIDPWRVSEQGLSYTGVVELIDFPRLAPLLIRPQGLVSYAFHFSRDGLGRPLIAGHAEATFWQTCQRCSQPVAIPVDSDFQLVVVEGLDEAAALSEEFDPLMADDAEINLLDLLEDELLLSLPVVARHEDCHAWRYDDEPIAVEERENPFRILKKLKH